MQNTKTCVLNDKLVLRIKLLAFKAILIVLIQKTKHNEKVLIADGVLLLGIAGNAQEKMEGRRNLRENPLTKEQRQELHLKKMTLDLDLSTAQQKEIRTVLNEQSNKREVTLANRKENKQKMLKN